MEQSKFYKERQWANGKSSIVPTPRRELAFYLWISDDWLNKTHSRKMRELKAQSQFHQYQVIILDYLVRNLSKPIEKGYIKVNNGKKNYKSQTVEAIKGELFYNTMFKNNDYLIKSNDPKDVLTVLFFDSDDK